MKIYFLQEMVYEYLGPMYLSAMLKKHGHDVELIVPDEEKGWFNMIKDGGLIAFSCMTSTHQWALRMARRIKKRYDVPVVFGGVHSTVFNEVINEEAVDYIAVGEADYSFAELVDKIEHGNDTTKIKGIWAKKNGKVYKNDICALHENLDELPFPDRELYYRKSGLLRELPTKRFMTGRGCPYQCSFCFNHVYLQKYKGKGKYVRRRSVDNVIQEIKEVKRKYGMKTVRFSDDTFAMDKKWLKEFLIKYRKEIGLPFTFLMVAGELDDELTRLAKLAKCSSVYFGIESGNEKIRFNVLCKYVSDKAIIETARLLRKYKIRFGTYNMAGLPTETVEDAFATIMLNAKIKADYPMCTILQPYPGTKIFDFCVEKGFVNENYSPDDIVTMFNNSVLKIKNKREIENLHRFFYIGCKFPWTIPIIRKLIKLPSNPLYKLIFLASYAHRSMKAMNFGIWDAIKFGLKFRRTVFKTLF